MRLAATDWGNGTLRRFFGMAVLGFFLAYFYGWLVLVFLGILQVLSVGREGVVRLRGVAGKPFTFCLPGFRESLRRRYFTAAALIGLGASGFPLIFALYRHARPPSLADTDPIELGLHMIAAFLIGMVVAFVVGTLRFVLSRLAWSILGLLSIPLFLLALVVVPVFVEYPLLGIPLCLAACLFVWFRLGDMRRVRRGHRGILKDAPERRTQVEVTKTAAPWVENMFRGLMEQRRQWAAMRHVWGSLYRAFGPTFSYWRWMAVSVVVAALILGYAGPWLVVPLFVLLGLAAQFVPLPAAFGGLWLPVGRRERYYETTGVAVATALLLMGVAGLVTICTWIFSPFLPSSGSLTYSGIDPKAAGLASLLVPWVLGCRLLGYAWPRTVHKTVDVIRWVVILGMISIQPLRVAGFTWPRSVGTILLTVGFVAGWVFFLLALRHVCAGASLIEPAPLGTSGE